VQEYGGAFAGDYDNMAYEMPQTPKRDFVHASAAAQVAPSPYSVAS
jgi:hypothetical protein